MNNILKGLLPEQIDFFNRCPGRIATALRESSNFEFATEDGVWVYLDGGFSHIDDSNDDPEALAEEQNENGVTRVVILDYYGAVVVAPESPELDCYPIPMTVHTADCDVYRVRLSQQRFREIQNWAQNNPDYVNETGSTDTVLSLSAPALREYNQQIQFVLWLKQQVQHLPFVTEVVMSIWH